MGSQSATLFVTFSSAQVSMSGHAFGRVLTFKFGKTMEKVIDTHQTRFIISSQYFLYFGILGISLPYFNLYCYHLGFTGFQIGLLSALKSVVMVIFSLMWGGIADRFQNRRTIFIACHFVSTGIWAFYFLTADFRQMLLIAVCHGIFHAPLIAFLEAFTMDLLGNEKRSYGKIRVWGTLSFIAATLILGKIIDIWSLRVILVLILAGSLIQSFFAIRIPEARHPKPETQNLKLDTRPQFQVSSFKFQIFLLCAFLMLVSHGAYYGFFSIHLENLGYGSTFIGIAWALSAASEILVMIFSDRIFRRFPVEHVLIFSFMVATCRWFALFFVASPLLILISQLLHAFTYGTFHIASILYIDRLSPDGAKTTGQVVNNAVTYGLGMMVGFLGNGYLYEQMDSFSLFAVSAFTALAGGVILSVSYRKSK